MSSTLAALTASGAAHAPPWSRAVTLPVKTAATFTHCRTVDSTASVARSSG